MSHPMSCVSGCKSRKVSSGKPEVKNFIYKVRACINYAAISILLAGALRKKQ